MADVTGASLTPIFNRLTQVPRHHPMEAQTFADWTTEAGDIVTMQRDGEDFAGPVHQTSMTWRGSAETRINSQENEEREDIEKVSKRKYGRSGSGMYNNNRLYYEMFDYNGELHSSLLMTESELRVHFDGLYDGLQSNLLLTRSELSTHFEGLYDGLQSSLLITRSEMSAAFINTYEGLQSHLLMTASALSATFEGLYDGLQSNLLITRSEMSATFENVYSGLQSHLLITASELSTTFENYYEGLQSHLLITASEMTTTFENFYEGISSHVSQTASSWSAVVYSRTSKAQIIARINEEGQTEDLIDAQRIKIGTSGSSLISLGSKISITSSGDLVLGAVVIKSDGVHADTIGNHYYVSQQPGGHEDKVGILKKAEVFENVLKIWKFGDADGSPSITFSKATVVSGDWSGTVYTATATQNGVTVGTASTSLHMQVDGAINPNETVYVKAFKDNPSVAANQLDMRELKMEEVTSGQRVKLSVKVTVNGVDSWVEKGSISTALTYQAGQNSIGVEYYSNNGTPSFRTASGVSVKTIPVYMQVEGATNPNETVYAKLYKTNTQAANNIGTNIEMKLEEVVSGQRVKLSTKVVSGGTTTWLEKGSVSTALTYQAGQNSIGVEYYSNNGTPSFRTASGVSVKTIPVYMQIEGAANPNATVYAKLYKTNTQAANNIGTNIEMLMEEVVDSKRVKLSTVVGNTLVEKGSVSTASTWNACGRTAHVYEATSVDPEQYPTADLSVGALLLTANTGDNPKIYMFRLKTRFTKADGTYGYPTASPQFFKVPVKVNVPTGGPTPTPTNLRVISSSSGNSLGVLSGVSPGKYISFMLGNDEYSFMVTG